MAALLIVNYNVTDRALLDEYREEAVPLLLGPGRGIPVAISAATVDLNEGTPAGTDTVLLRYDSVEAAQAAFRSEAYQKALKKRFDATEPRIGLIVETLD